MVPKGVNSWRTSSSVCCLLSIPTNSFRSAMCKNVMVSEVFIKIAVKRVKCNVSVTSSDTPNTQSHTRPLFI